jgi:TRAP-type C4-dicarboxylate transport system permease small subunit
MMSAVALQARTAAALRRPLDWVDWVVARFVIAVMAVMVLTVSAQVLLRYGFNVSLDWAEEVSRLCFVWSVFLALPLGIKRGAHVGITLLTDALPSRVRLALFRLTSTLAIILMVVVAHQAVLLTRDQWDEPMSTLDYSVGLFILPVAIAAVHSIPHLLVGALGEKPATQELAIE